MIRYLFGGLIIFFLSSCSSSVERRDTKFPVGQKLYLSKCSSCHRLYDPGEFTPSQWDTILFSMRKKAKTSPEEEAEILKFLKENF